LVEDECLIAMDIAMMVSEGGCDVLGPAASVAEAMALLARTTPDMALLDVRIRDGLSFPVAAELKRRAVPFAFLTSMIARDMPDEFRAVPIIAKPVMQEVLMDGLRALGTVAAR
jgi:two-component SAPR family response regulator